MENKFEFQIGDFVKWRSHGKGSFTDKQGMVVQRLRRGEVVDKVYWKSLRIPDNRGVCRNNQESYVITVNGRYYWPKTCKLQIVRRARKKKEA